MSSNPTTLPGGSRGPDVALRAAARAAWARLQDEGAPVLAFSLTLTLTLILLPHQLRLDGWLTLVSGREVVVEGLPDVDTLTVMTSGTQWVDQQWLAQAFYYLFADLGGIRLAMLAHAAVVALALGIALVAARRLGGTPRNVAVAAAAATLVAPWAVQLRSQTLALPLFAMLLWLLAADSREPSRRVFLVLPLLALWANLHGTVIMGALFVALRGAVYVGERHGRQKLRDRLGRALLLVLAPFACIFVSPYALDLPAYYRSLLLNSDLRAIAPEWGASTPSALTIGFYAVAVVSLGLFARRRSRLTTFEQGAFLATVVLGATALRSVIWFAFVAVLFLPRLLDAKATQPPGPRLRLALAAALTALVVSVGAAAARPESWYTSSWPQPAADRVAQQAAASADTRIFSDGRFGSWLMWTRPELRGRISHDVRWELYTRSQLRTLLAFDRQDGRWRRALRGYDVLVLDRQTHPRQVLSLQRDGLRTIWSDERVAVLLRG